jgi:hypothetical protein
MIEIRNNTRGPVNLMVRSRTAVRQFTTIIVPGIGSGKNVYLLEDERYTPDSNIDVIKKAGLISIRNVPNKQ